jgi:predicted nuclease with TOPRIM domain
MAERAAKTIDERFDEVTQAFLDQRDFTVFCHDKLRDQLQDEIRQSEGRLSGRLDRLEGKVDRLEGKIGGLEGKVGGLEGKVGGMAQAIDRRFTRNELLLTEILNEVKRR